MNCERRSEYGEKIRVLEIECDKPYKWESGNATHMRVCMEPCYENRAEMLERGFFFADRTLAVSINLASSSVDYNAFVRTEPLLTSQHKDEVLAIARESFFNDRRFHLAPKPDMALAEAVLARWVEALDKIYLCRIKEKTIGFLALTGSGNERFVHLAAVLERYRMSGAALSLYAAAARDCKKSGVRFLNGRVSTENMAVMNLYSFLGGKFSKPMDVYLKEL